MAQARRHTAAWKDPIVEDVRAAREALLAECNYNLKDLVKRLRQDQDAEGRRIVKRPARRPRKAHGGS